VIAREQTTALLDRHDDVVRRLAWVVLNPAKLVGWHRR
jgi:hypothetical protein